MTYREEMDYIDSPQFKLGEYLYMGMGYCNNHRVCISVGYKLDYCIKKAEEFVEASKELVTFDKVHKVKVGELVKCDELVM